MVVRKIKINRIKELRREKDKNRERRRRRVYYSNNNKILRVIPCRLRKTWVLWNATTKTTPWVHPLTPTCTTAFTSNTPKMLLIHSNNNNSIVIKSRLIQQLLIRRKRRRRGKYSWITKMIIRFINRIPLRHLRHNRLKLKVSTIKISNSNNNRRTNNNSNNSKFLIFHFVIWMQSKWCNLIKSSRTMSKCQEHTLSLRWDISHPLIQENCHQKMKKSICLWWPNLVDKDINLILRNISKITKWCRNSCFIAGSSSNLKEPHYLITKNSWWKIQTLWNNSSSKTTESPF